MPNIYELTDSFVSVVDPGQRGTASLVYSTFLGGSGSGIGDNANSIALGPAGDVVIAGKTGSFDFPTTSNAFRNACPNLNTVSRPICSSGFVSIIDPTASTSAQLVYSTYLEGTNSANAVAVDSSGRLYLAGQANFLGLPTTPTSYDPDINNFAPDFVLILNPALPPADQLAYGSYFGSTASSGNESITSMALGPSGRIYLAGYTFSQEFPVTPDAIQATCLACVTAYQGMFGSDAFFSVLDPSLNGQNELVYSTYLGGNISDRLMGIALNPAGEVALVGSSTSSDYPITSGAFQPHCKACTNFPTNTEGGAAPVGNAVITEFSFPDP